MDRASARSRCLARAIIAATCLFALAPVLQGRAQDANPEAAPADAAGATADQPRSRRARRRAAEAAAAPEAQAVAATADGASAEPAAVAVEEELVCKKIQLTGTKIAKRVCGTQAQWDARNRRTSEEAQDAVREVGQRSQFPAAPEVMPAATGIGLGL